VVWCLIRICSGQPPFNRKSLRQHIIRARNYPQSLREYSQHLRLIGGKLGVTSVVFACSLVSLRQHIIRAQSHPQSLMEYSQHLRLTGGKLGATQRVSKWFPSAVGRTSEAVEATHQVMELYCITIHPFLKSSSNLYSTYQLHNSFWSLLVVIPGGTFSFSFSSTKIHLFFGAAVLAISAVQGHLWLEGPATSKRCGPIGRPPTFSAFCADHTQSTKIQKLYNPRVVLLSSWLTSELTLA
jgi:hypothetical protein